MKACLVVVDYQNDFVCGSLGFAKAVELEDKIAKKIKLYRKNGDSVVFTLDTHKTDYLRTREGKHLPIEHCINGTEGHKLYGKIAELKSDDDKYFCKPSFGSGELYEFFKENNFDKIELCGVVTNICVISNAVLAQTACPSAQVCVDKNCVASNDDTLNEKALEVMRGLQIEIE